METIILCGKMLSSVGDASRVEEPLDGVHFRTPQIPRLILRIDAVLSARWFVWDIVSSLISAKKKTIDL